MQKTGRIDLLAGTRNKLAMFANTPADLETNPAVPVRAVQKMHPAGAGAPQESVWDGLFPRCQRRCARVRQATCAGNSPPNSTAEDPSDANRKLGKSVFEDSGVVLSGGANAKYVSRRLFQ